MKLWLISQTVNNDYDTYSDAVVAADTRTEARHFHPGGIERQYRDGAWQIMRKDGSYFSPCDTWASPEQVKAELLGTAKKDTKAGVICSSFHAG